MAVLPRSRLAADVLPEPLHRAAVHVFAQGIEGAMLVGGTALAGYYAGHRRSDDLDLFVAHADAHRATRLAVESLGDLGAEVEGVVGTAQFFKASCRLDGHAFTADVVLDANLHRVGEAHEAGDGVVVASLETLLRTKAATIVGRCSEKDLYDLAWLFGALPDVCLERLVELGAEIDAGLTPETCLIGLLGARLSESACGFALGGQSAAEVFGEITALKARLEEVLDRLARGQPTPKIGELVRALE